MSKKILWAVLLICIISAMAGCFLEDKYSYYAEEVKGRSLKTYIKQNGEINVDGVMYKPMQWSLNVHIDEGELIGLVDDRDNGFGQTALYDVKQYPDKSFLIYSYEWDYGSGLCYSCFQRSDMALPEFKSENIDSIEWVKNEKVDIDLGFSDTRKPNRDPEIIKRLFEELNKKEGLLILDNSDNEKDFHNNYEYIGQLFCYNDDWPDFSYSLRIWYNGKDCCTFKGDIEIGAESEIFKPTGEIFVPIDFNLIMAINGKV